MVTIYALLVCKIVGPKIQSSKIFEECQVVLWLQEHLIQLGQRELRSYRLE